VRQRQQQVTGQAALGDLGQVAGELVAQVDQHQDAAHRRQQAVALGDDVAGQELRHGLLGCRRRLASGGDSVRLGRASRPAAAVAYAIRGVRDTRPRTTQETS
jgi:hypothetical protein